MLESLDPPSSGPLSGCQIVGDYCVLGVRGWTLNFALPLISEVLPLGEQVFHEVDDDLRRIEGFLPEHVVSFLHRTSLPMPGIINFSGLKIATSSTLMTQL